MSTNKFDDLLTQLGTGKWNLLYFLGSAYWCLWMPPQFISGIYLAPAVNYTCLPPENESVVEISQDSCSYMVRTSSSAELEEELCSEWDFDTSVFSSTITSEFSLVCGRGHLRATYQSIYMLGTFISPLLAGYLADRFGRKIVVVVTQVVTALTSLSLCFLTNFIAILIVRFIMGSVNLLTFFILALEVCEPKHRGTVGILTGLPWALGTMAWGAMAYLIRDWRWLQAAVSLPTVLNFFPLYFMDESPRWLIVNGQHDSALRVLQKAARWNNATIPLEEDLRDLMRNIQDESSTPLRTRDTTQESWPKEVMRIPPCAEPLEGSATF
ncbi:organic cation transporter-like protein [Homarus americanus]|uniref:organic cation transporter-like protein n=1 Tax=Homarus americanus TaxID=6706 RepID=UPI001C4576D6|nr:organic cation transporter-like protein [Homarus americanus]